MILTKVRRKDSMGYSIAEVILPETHNSKRSTSHKKRTKLKHKKMIKRQLAKTTWKKVNALMLLMIFDITINNDQ